MELDCCSAGKEYEGQFAVADERSLKGSFADTERSPGEISGSLRAYPMRLVQSPSDLEYLDT